VATVVPYWTRSSNVEWCEAVSSAYGSSPVVAEFWNTASNLPFLCVAMLGYMRASKNNLPRPFFALEITLMVVGLGSATFHATQTYTGELLDEMPMSAVALCYLWSLKGLHKYTQGECFRWTMGSTLLVVTIAWALYLSLHLHDIFVMAFVFQLVVVEFLLLHCGPWGYFSAQRRLWWLSIASIGTGKLAWEYERWLYRTSACPQGPLQPAFWLHPFWHCAAALAHYFGVKYTFAIRAALMRLEKDFELEMRLDLEVGDGVSS